MAFKLLFALFYAENADALLGEPLDHERRFVIAPAKAVEHKHEQYVKALVHGVLAQFLDGISIIGGNLKARNSLFAQFLDDIPPLLLGKFAAFDALHGDIVMVYLSLGGHAI